MILGNLLLALAWVALSGQFTLQSLLTGAVLGRLVLLVLARGGVLPVREVGRVERALALLAYLLWQIVLANFRVALDVIRIRHRMQPGVIRVPLDVTTEGGMRPKYRALIEEDLVPVAFPSAGADQDQFVQA